MSPTLSKSLAGAGWLVRPAPMLAVSLLICAAGSTTIPHAQEEPSRDPELLRIVVDATPDEAGARVTLTFSEEVEYRLEESRTRLTLHLDRPLDEGSLLDRTLEDETVRRIRVSSSSRRAEVVFHLGRQFDTFGSTEARSPFRIILRFHRKGAPIEPITAEGVPGVAGGEGTAPAPGAAEEDAAPGGAGVGDGPEGAPVIVLDPGHGGSEDGAVGPKGLKEKDLTLDIARRLRPLLIQAGYRVLLTREDDAALDLTRRTASANHAGAAAFLSIHANASARPGARGAETYFLSHDAVADEGAMETADQENRAPLSAWDSSGDPAGQREIRMVLWEMAQAEHLASSSRLADLIQGELNGLGETKDRGVKQAPFRVLVGADMPAVLVEVGFLSHPEEERMLSTPEYRDQLAAALAAAIGRFDREHGPARVVPGAPLSDGAPR